MFKKEETIIRNRYSAVACSALAFLICFMPFPAHAVPTAPGDPAAMPVQTGEGVQQELVQQPAQLSDGVVRYLFDNDQTLTLPKNNVSHHFIAPQSTKISDTCLLRLHVTYSQTLIDELSSLTVSVNGTPVETRGIVDKGTYTFDWKVAFDSALIKRGDYNEIKITAVQRSIEGECADIDNPSNWVLLHKDSYLRMQLSAAKKPPLSDFLSLYYDTFAERFTIANDYILADTKDVDTLAAMLGASNAAGLHYPDRAMLRIGVYGKDTPLASDTNKIFIEKAQQPSAGMAAPALEPPLSPGEGYVAIEGVNDREPYYKLFLGARDATGFEKAAALLSNNRLLLQAQDAAIRLQSSIPAQDTREEKVSKVGNVYPLSDYGYSDLKLAGTFHQRMDLSFSQRDGIRSGAGSYVDLHFRHSAALLSDRSLLTVSINNTPLDSVKLSPGNAQGGNLRIYFPESALDQPVINVGVEVYHYLGKVDCTKDYYDVAWTVIDAQKSKVFFEQGKNGLRPSLRGFPFFYSGGDASQIAISLSPESVKTAALLSVRTGQNNRRAFAWHVQNGGEMEKALLEKSDLVFLADVRSAALPQEVSDALAITVKNGSYVIQDKTLEVIPETLAGKAVVQALRSPWNFYKTAYVLLYDGEQGLAQLTALLAERENLNRMEGQLCLLGQNAQVQSFAIEPRSRQEDAAPKTAGDYIREAEAFTGMNIWIILLIAALLVFLVLVIVSISRRRYDEYKRAGEALKRQQGFLKEDEEEAHTEDDKNDKP